MPQITQQQRIARIEQLLKALNTDPPEKHETVRLPWPGQDLLCPVIRIGADEVLLNPRSHRVRSQLEDDVEWKEVSADPLGQTAQRIIERFVRGARKPDDLAGLRDSLLKEGQAEPGVMTFDGVLVNANTRAVVIREFDDPAKKYLRVAVLPSHASPDELSLLELRLQMQKPLKVDYSLTNELLFIEELSSERELKDGQIAKELRIFPENDKKGAAEVNLRLKLLDLIRNLQLIPSQRIPITFFDRLGYEQLREVYRIHQGLLARDDVEAQNYLEAFLLTIATGITPVHKIRKIDADFMASYMLPQLEEDEMVGPLALQLTTEPSSNAPTPKGAKALLGDRENESGDEVRVDVKRLIDFVTGSENTVVVPNSVFRFPKEVVVDAVKSAISSGLVEKGRDVRDENKLDAPIGAVKGATNSMTRAVEALTSVASDPEFDAKRRKSLEAAFKRLSRTFKALDAALIKYEIKGK